VRYAFLSVQRRGSTLRLSVALSCFIICTKTDIPARKQTLLKCPSLVIHRRDLELILNEVSSVIGDRGALHACKKL
jgi:hypothetical protein